MRSGKRFQLKFTFKILHDLSCWSMTFLVTCAVKIMLSKPYRFAYFTSRIENHQKMQSYIALCINGRHGFTYRTNKTCMSSLPITADSDTAISTLKAAHFAAIIEAGKSQPHQDTGILVYLLPFKKQANCQLQTLHACTTFLRS